MGKLSKCCVPGCTDETSKRHRFPLRDEALMKAWLDNICNPVLNRKTYKDVYKSYYVCHKHFALNLRVPCRKSGLKADAIPTLYLDGNHLITDSVTPQPQASDTDVGFNLSSEDGPLSEVNQPLWDLINFRTSSLTSVTNETSHANTTENSRPSQTTSGFSSPSGQGFGVSPTPSTDSELCSKENTSILQNRLTADLPPVSAKLPNFKMVSMESVSLNGGTYFVTGRKPKLRVKDLSPQALEFYNEAAYLKRRMRQMNKSNASFRQKLIEARKALAQNSRDVQKVTRNIRPKKQFSSGRSRNVRKPKVRNHATEKKRKLKRTAYLRKLICRVPVKPGLLQEVFVSLASKAKDMSDRERYCILLFDAIEIQPNLICDTDEDKTGSFEDGTQNLVDHVSVFMLQGIFRKWKQPIGFVIHKAPMPASTIVRYIKKILSNCEKIGFPIVASVCDQGSNNVKAINYLIEETKRRLTANEEELCNNYIVTIDNTSFIPLFDPPRLIKSIRNNFLAKDLTFIMDGVKKKACWSHIEKAYKIDKSNNINVMKDINDSHFVCEKIKNMSVSIAEQIFSSSVAAAVKYCALSGLKSADGLFQLDISALETAELLLLFENIFDSLSGNVAKGEGNVLKEFVSSESPHTAIWLDALRIIESMEFVAGKSWDRNRPPVLIGWEITLNGFLEIWKKLFNLDYFKFAPWIFNLDPLEDFFCQMRKNNARNVNPTYSLFCSCYKSLFGQNIQSQLSKSNCEDGISQPESAETVT